MNPIDLSLFSSRMEAICEEMGAVLRRAAFSPNIRDRLDYSCALFDPQGELCAQAAHIPVHLGSMAFAMRDIVGAVNWSPGDGLILNDPYLGGTHLPDVTLIAPCFALGELVGFVANRAHHADIGAESPGSMPVSASLDEEGLLLAPQHLIRADSLDQALWNAIIGRTRNPDVSAGDLAAQISANRTGLQRLGHLVGQMGLAAFRNGLDAINDYAERLARDTLRRLPRGDFAFSDCMDDDGQGQRDIEIRVRLHLDPMRVLVDFSGTAPQVAGNINCPLSVAAAAVLYVFRCLMPEQAPACAGLFRPIEIRAPLGSLLNARPPAAVAAGNVETSSRVVDVVMGALAQAIPDLIPAASQGSMNNVAMGYHVAGSGWDYYETIGGGMGAGPQGGGLSGVQTHMTNTRNTPVEVIESRYPLRVTRYSLRRGSGGTGARRGGDGLVREFEFLAPTQVSLLTERRRHAPWGLAGGEAGKPGRNRLNGAPLGAKLSFVAEAGDRLTLETPGGGGWGLPSRPEGENGKSGA